MDDDSQAANKEKGNLLYFLKKYIFTLAYRYVQLDLQKTLLLLLPSSYKKDTGCFFTGPPPKKLKYGKPRLGEVRCI